LLRKLKRFFQTAEVVFVVEVVVGVVVGVVVVFVAVVVGAVELPRRLHSGLESILLI
jgi:hypothetical protein